jgi:hypothetical protein
MAQTPWDDRDTTPEEDYAAIGNYELGLTVDIPDKTKAWLDTKTTELGKTGKTIALIIGGALVSIPVLGWIGRKVG